MTDVDLDGILQILRERGALFAYVFGSRVDGTARDDSDWDVGAFYGRHDVVPWEAAAGLPGRVGESH